MERKTITTSLEVELVKLVKHLAVDTDKNFNELLEEALQDLLKKYKKPVK